MGFYWVGIFFGGGGGGREIIWGFRVIGGDVI